jgi:hypothetical protein
MVEVTSHTGNPIDLVEEIVVANDWRTTVPARKR